MDYISQSLFGRNEECPEKTLIWGPNSLESLIFVQHSLTAWDPGKTARHIWMSKNADSVTASGLAPVSAATWGCCVWCWGALPCWRPRHIFSAVCLCVCQMKAAFHNATITPWSVWQLCKSTPQPPSGCQAWLHLIPHVWLKAAVTALCKAGRKRSRVWHPLVINQVWYGLYAACSCPGSLLPRGCSPAASWGEGAYQVLPCTVDSHHFPSLGCAQCMVHLHFSASYTGLESKNRVLSKTVHLPSSNNIATWLQAWTRRDLWSNYTGSKALPKFFQVFLGVSSLTHWMGSIFQVFEVFKFLLCLNVILPLL